MAGGLMWLATKTRPDLAFVASRVATFATSRPHASLLLGKRALRYLIGTRKHGLVYRPATSIPLPDDDPAVAPQMTLDGYADASFEPDMSQSGISCFFAECLIEWRSCKQSTVARSTAESEATALAMGVLMLECVEAILHAFLMRIGRPRLWGDNTASLLISAGPSLLNLASLDDFL